MSKPSSCSFQFTHYRFILKSFIDNNYDVVSFRDFDIRKPKKYVIVRHDIDSSIERALELAKFENQLGVKTSYFIRLHSKMYNPFEYRTYAQLKEIKNLGHEIGLHFETLDFDNVFHEGLKNIFLREKSCLEQILNIKVETVSQHGDFSEIGRDYEKFFKMLSVKELGIKRQAYEDRFFKKIKYVSDSLGVWRNSCPCKLVNACNQLQILFHPDYWYKHSYSTW